MKVKDILKAKRGPVISIEPHRTLKDAMDTIMKNKVGALLVMEGETLEGIITERDLFREYHQTGDKALSRKIGEVMTTDLVVGLPEDDIEAVQALMTNNRFRHLPIMQDKKVCGIVSIGDVVKILAVNLKIENRYLKDYITGKYPA